MYLLLLLLSSLRHILLSLFLAPILLPPIFLSSYFPTSLALASSRLISLISTLAGHPLTIAPSSPPPHLKNLRPPTLCSSTTTFPTFTIHTYDQPGLWMSTPALLALRQILQTIAKTSLPSLPSHALFSAPLRQTFSTRIIALASTPSGTPLAFTAMAYLPHADAIILHLGLTIISPIARRRRLQSPLHLHCLFTHALNQRSLSYTVTSIAASPAGIGAVADYFSAYPHYRGTVPRTKHHLAVARHVLANFRHHFGCSASAPFDEDTFVVKRSNAADGGGCAALIPADGRPTSRHSSAACNAWVRDVLDLEAGDEIFQVGRLDVMASFRRYFLRRVGF